MATPSPAVDHHNFEPITCRVKLCRLPYVWRHTHIGVWELVKYGDIIAVKMLQKKEANCHKFIQKYLYFKYLDVFLFKYF